MQFIIENESLKVTVDSVGCEVTSIIGKNDGTEYLWIGDPEYWAQHAPSMFPICGRLTDGKCTYEGKTYEIGCHGFARKMEFTLAEKTPTSISMTLTADESTLAQYPFNFVFTITHTLDGTTVRTDFKVENKGENTMPYAVGGHPGFNIPLGGAGEFTDYYLEFETPCDVKEIVCKECFITETLRPLATEGGKIRRLTHDMFDNDAVIITDMAPAVSLKSTATDKSVTLRYDGMNYVSLWHKPLVAAPYVCIEPWTSIPDYFGKSTDIMEKRDLFHLAAGASAEHGYSITIGL